MLCYEIGSNALSGMALISSSAMFLNLQWSDLTRHVLIIISEEQAKVHKPKRPLENSPQTWLIITSALFFWSKQITGLPFPLSPSRRVKTVRNRCHLVPEGPPAVFRESFCTWDIFVIGLPHCYSKGIVIELWNDQNHFPVHICFHFCCSV